MSHYQSSVLDKVKPESYQCDVATGVATRVKERDKEQEKGGSGI